MKFQWKKIGEQALHVLYPSVCLIPMAILQNEVGLILSGLGFIAIREGLDQWPINNIKDTILDSVFCAVGVSMVAWFVY